MRNPYRGYHANPIENPSVYDFDAQFEDWLSEQGFDADQILEIWEDLNKLDDYAERFMETMADLWEEARGEDAYEAAEYERKFGGLL